MATFQSLKATRLGGTLKKIQLLGNLARYDHTEAEARELCNALKGEAQGVVDAFARKWGWSTTQNRPAPVVEAPAAPVTPVEGELDRSDLGDVRWAYEMLRRGERDDGMEMLRRVLERNAYRRDAQHGNS